MEKYVVEVERLIFLDAIFQIFILLYVSMQWNSERKYVCP